MGENRKVTLLRSKKRCLTMRLKPKGSKRFSLAAVFAVVLDVPFLRTRATVNAEVKELEHFIIDSIAEARNIMVPPRDYTSIAKQSLLEQFPNLQGIKVDHVVDAEIYSKWSEDQKRIFGRRFTVKK